MSPTSLYLRTFRVERYDPASAVIRYWLSFTSTLDKANAADLIEDRRTIRFPAVGDRAEVMS